MLVLALAAKVSVAAALLAAGGAKLADLAGFAAVVRLLIPVRVPAAAVRAAAAAVAAAELAAGGVSLALPGLGGVGLVVAVLACGFVAVSVLGYARHRGRACHCFGPLPGGRFDARGLARSATLAMAACLGLRGAPPAVTGLSTAGHVLLALAGSLVALAAFSAARAARLLRKMELERS